MQLFDGDEYSDDRWPEPGEPTRLCKQCNKVKPVRAFAVKETYYPSLKKRYRAECKRCERINARTRNMRRQGNTMRGECEVESCDYCGELVVDHDHETQQVRGHICPGCNTALGGARDNPEILAGLITHLLKAKQ